LKSKALAERDNLAAENRALKAELARVREQRDQKGGRLKPGSGKVYLGSENMQISPITKNYRLC